MCSEKQINFENQANKKGSDQNQKSLKYLIASFVYPVEAHDNNLRKTHVTQKLNVSEIVHEYKNRLTGFIRKRVDRTEDAEDVLQEVFYQLAEADRLMTPIDQMAGWLFAVARNRITDLYRKKKPDLFPEPYADVEEENVMEELGSLFVDAENNPEMDYLRALIMEEFDEALNELPPEQRAAFEMHELQGKSFNEISEQTGVSVNTLISRKRYAVLYLRQRLGDLYDELINF